MLLSQPSRPSGDWMSEGACRGEDPELFFPIAATARAERQIRASVAQMARSPERREANTDGKAP